MQTYVPEIRRITLQILAWGIFVCGVLAAAGYQALIAGFILGLITGLIYFLLIGYRVQKCAGLPLKRAVAFMRVGWVIRAALIILMLAVAVRAGEFSFWAAVAGLFSLYSILALNAVFFIAKRL